MTKHLAIDINVTLPCGCTIAHKEAHDTTYFIARDAAIVASVLKTAKPQVVALVADHHCPEPPQ